MKFPSIFRTASPTRFDIKPRYYDPVREEIEQRTARIKRELEAEGVIEGLEKNEAAYVSGLKGGFSQYRGIRERSGENVFTSTAMVRTFIFLILMGSVFGYLYIGPEIFEYILYIGATISGIYFFLKLKPKRKDE